jgi:hypothetical protein
VYECIAHVAKEIIISYCFTRFADLLFHYFYWGKVCTRRDADQHPDIPPPAGVSLQLKSRKTVDTVLIHIMISAMKKRLLLLPFSLLAVSLAVGAAGIPAGGFAGTWSANFTKSKFPGPPPKVDMCIIDADGTVTVKETTSEGKDVTWHYTPVDGQPVSIVGRENTMVTVHKVNDHTIEHTWNIEGRAAKSSSVLSKDGKTTVFTMDGTGKDGKPFHEMVVYDKQ